MSQSGCIAVHSTSASHAMSGLIDVIQLRCGAPYIGQAKIFWAPKSLTDVVQSGEAECRIAAELSEGLSSKEIDAECRDHGGVVLEFGTCPLVERIRASLRCIREDIRGDFEPCDTTLTLGNHGLSTCVGANATRIVPARISIQFWGYGSPKDWEKYRECVANDSIMSEFTRQLADEIGQVTISLMWWV